jgi:hypothetical protein
VSKFYIGVELASRRSMMPINYELYRSISQAIETQWEALYHEQKFDFVVENYLEFEEAILGVGLERMVDRGDRFCDHQRHAALFNRRIMNLLTTFKSYVDSVPQHFNRIFSRDEAVTKAALAAFSEAYDSRIGYWIIPKLRNYIQHQGFPVHAMSYSYDRAGSGDDGQSESLRNTVDLFITRDELSKGVERKDWLEEISRMNDKIDLKFVVRDFMEGLTEAHMKNRVRLRDRVEWAASTIKVAQEDYIAETGDQLLPLLKAVCVGGEHPTVLMHQIADDQRRYLEGKNGQLINLASRFFSNAITTGKVFR